MVSAVNPSSSLPSFLSSRPASRVVWVWCLRTNPPPPVVAWVWVYVASRFFRVFYFCWRMGSAAGSPGGCHSFAVAPTVRGARRGCAARGACRVAPPRHATLRHCDCPVPGCVPCVGGLPRWLPLSPSGGAGGATARRALARSPPPLRKTGGGGARRGPCSGHRGECCVCVFVCVCVAFFPRVRSPHSLLVEEGGDHQRHP